MKVSLKFHSNVKDYEEIHTSLMREGKLRGNQAILFSAELGLMIRYITLLCFESDIKFLEARMIYAMLAHPS